MRDDSSAILLQNLRDAGRPLSFDELSARLHAGTAAAKSRISRDLEGLLHAGEILRNRRDEYCLRERLPVVIGAA